MKGQGLLPAEMARGEFRCKFKVCPVAIGGRWHAVPVKAPRPDAKDVHFGSSTGGAHARRGAELAGAICDGDASK
jgi:hypothetical protein